MPTRKYPCPLNSVRSKRAIFAYWPMTIGLITPLARLLSLPVSYVSLKPTPGPQKKTGAHLLSEGKERRAGKIINVGSVAGHLPVHTGIIYAAAKRAIAHYTRCLAEQLRPYNVTVNCIAPAPTYSGRFLATRVVTDQGERPRLQRVAQPEDMARIVLFLAGPQSDFLTGETIVCWPG